MVALIWTVGNCRVDILPYLTGDQASPIETTRDV